MFVGPVTHVTCDLNTQKRILDARRDSAVRAALGGRTWLDRLLGRRARPSAVEGSALRAATEDVWHSLRY
jgi:hypothetical protein